MSPIPRKSINSMRCRPDRGNKHASEAAVTLVLVKQSFNAIRPHMRLRSVNVILLRFFCELPKSAPGLGHGRGRKAPHIATSRDMIWSHLRNNAGARPKMAYQAQQ